MNKESVGNLITKQFLEQELLRKYFKPIDGVDLIDEYPKIKLKISTLSKHQRDLVLQGVKAQCLDNPEVKAIIDNIDKLIEEKLANEQKGTATES